MLVQCAIHEGRGPEVPEEKHLIRPEGDEEGHGSNDIEEGHTRAEGKAYVGDVDQLSVPRLKFEAGPREESIQLLLCLGSFDSGTRSCAAVLPRVSKPVHSVHDHDLYEEGDNHLRADLRVPSWGEVLEALPTPVHAGDMGID